LLLKLVILGFHWIAHLTFILVLSGESNVTVGELQAHLNIRHVLEVVIIVFQVLGDCGRHDDSRSLLHSGWSDDLGLNLVLELRVLRLVHLGLLDVGRSG